MRRTMMKYRLIILSLLLFLIASLGAAACSGAGTTTDRGESSDTALLSEEYEDALSIQGQLALGTVLLEETDLAVDESQAAELLPLWQALQSLNNSNTAAQAELDAVVNQIAGAMTPEQIEAIREMQLTSESLSEVDALAPGVGSGPGAVAEDDDEASEGGGPGGGPPGGGFAGGGPGSGPGAGGGLPGGGFPGGGPNASDELSEDDLATRQAQFDSGAFQEQRLTFAVVSLLQAKTGEAPQGPRGRAFATTLDVVAEETGLTTEKIEAAMAEGSSLADIIESNGADVERVRAALIKALSEMDLGEADPESVADQWLGSAE